MKIEKDVTCGYCKKVFCCLQCCNNHKLNNHAIIVHKPDGAMGDYDVPPIEIIYAFCPICEEKPLILHQNMYPELLKHIESIHLPLNCQKCEKRYTEISDLIDFTKCPHASNPCNKLNILPMEKLCEESALITANSVQIPVGVSISTQTSPIVDKMASVEIQTPNSIVHFRLQTKSKTTNEEFISDSVSSIKNVSTLSSLSLVKGKGKLVRSTSTPVHSEFFKIKPKEQTFNCSGGQVSSIYNTGCELPNTPAILNGNGKSPKLPVETINRYKKVNGRVKFSAVTPLRQVMSKSIQKAFAQHGSMPVDSMQNIFYKHRKKIFDSMDVSCVDSPSKIKKPEVSSPLDLRLSPAIRRTQDEVCCKPSSTMHYLKCNKSPPKSREVVLSSQKLTRESIVITCTQHMTSVESISSSSSSSLSSIRSDSTSNYGGQSPTSINSTGGNSVYKTCRSVEIITATELSEVSIAHELTNQDMVLENKDSPYSASNNHYCNVTSTTPKCIYPSTIKHKKIIKFETPKIENGKSKGLRNSQIIQTSRDEVFFTPNTTPKRKYAIEKKSYIHKGAARKLTGHFSPQRRITIKDNCQTKSNDHKENNNNGVVKAFIINSNSKDIDIENKNPKLNDGYGGIWSFSTLLNSVRRISSLTGLPGRSGEKSINKGTANSILKRCASIAGSLVRSKSIENHQLTTLKRKRTYTLDYAPTHRTCITSSTSPNVSVSTKRFRIQARRPIRHNSIPS